MKKNAVYYMAMWLAFGFVAGAISQPVLSPNADGTMSEGYYWVTVLGKAEWGLLFGAICGVLFTIYQNIWNKDRVRNKAWAGGIAIWMGVKFLWVGVASILAA